MSANFANRGKNVWAQGFPGTNSKRHTQYPSNAPQFLSKAQGPYVWDEENRRYIDFVGALGTIILGHNHPKVHEAVSAQLNTGLISSTFATTVEVECAEVIQDMLGLEKLRFLSNGADCTEASLRIARALQFIRGRK